MTTAGEAAALFGADDSAADPFSLGALGAEAEQAVGQDPFAGQDLHSATDLFGSTSAEDSAFLPQNEGLSQSSYEYVGTNNSLHTSTGQYTSGNYSDSSNYAETRAGGYAQEPASQGYSSQPGQWGGYEPQQYNPPVNGSYGGHSQSSSEQYTSYNPSSTYAPPAPVNSSTYTTYVPTTHDTHAYAPTTTNTSTQAIYDPYKPTQTTQQPVYSSTASVGATYDPYKPSQTVSQHTVSATLPQAQYSYPQFTATTSTLTPAINPPPPPQPNVTAEIFRPKTSNAYDPPLPPPKPAVRRTPAPAWPAPPSQAPYTLTTSPPITRPPLSAGLPPPQRPPSMPPPPPRSRSTVSDYAPPQPASHFPRGHTATPPPPRTVSRGAISPPSTLYNKTVSPPPMTPPVRQYTPLQQPEHAHAPNGHSSTYSTTHQEPPHNQYGTQAPTVNHGMAGPVEPPLSSQTSHPLSNGFGTHVPPLHTTPGLPPIPATDEDEDPEGGVFEGEDIWNGEEQEPTARYDTLVGPEPVVEPSSKSYQADVDVLHEHGAESHAFVYDGEQNGLSSVDHSPQSTWDGSAVSAQEQTATPASPASLNEVKSSPESLYDPYNPHRATAYQIPSRTHTPDRATSPGNASIRSWSSSQKHSLDQDRNHVPPGPPVRQSTKDSFSAVPYDPYSPSSANVQRSASPSYSIRSVGSTQSHVSRDPYAPSTASKPASIRNRSESNGSMLSHGTSSVEDPYAPSRHRQASVESSSYRSFSALQGYPETVASTSAGPTQIISLAPPAHAPYAPSPSLLGTNDPLGRTSVRIPVISFGFGGKVATCFHGTSALNTGFDIAMSSRASSVVHIRLLHTAIPQSALETTSATFPGPLFSDPGSPTTTLVRTGASTQTKNKKAKITKYLEERAEEISQGIGYLHQGSVEGFRAEAKLAMIKLLKVMVENDGRLSGSSQIEAAVRSALLPDIESSPDSPTEALHVPALASTSYPGLGSVLPDDTTIATHTLRSSQLSKIQRHLLRGDRRAAYQYAADERLWAHAMVIASSIDKEAWKEVVTEFLRSELTSASATHHASDTNATQGSGQEPLKVAYSLFAGQGPASVQELLPPRPLASMQSLQILPPTGGAATPLSASFPPTLPSLQLPKDILAKWKETAGMILSGTLTNESSSALTALGDQLVANSWIEAAHVCYLLSPQTSPVGGAGFPTGRVILYGSPGPQVLPHFWKDPDPVIFSEIVEFALSLSTPAKGQEAFAGLPHLQPYRLIRAAYLAELGYMDLANRYCDAISNSLGRSSPYLNATFGAQLKDLVDRLTAAPVIDKSASWKMARPSLDKLSGWLERGFTSFIAGEGDSPKPVETNGKGPTFSGPFTHFSAISSEASSAISSPQMSTTNLTEIPAAPPFRTGSAMALRPSSSTNQIARASSAMDYLRRKPSPVPRISSASATSSSFGDLPSRSQNQSPYGYPYAPPDVTPKADQSSLLSDMGDDQEGSLDTPSGPQLGGWWSNAPTPTASSFTQPEPSHGTSTEGFISMMDDTAYTPSATQRSHSESHLADVDEDDDLGLGNSSRKAKTNTEVPQETPQGKPAAEVKKSESPNEGDKSAAPAGGWFSRLWKRNDGTPGPVKANLGEQSSFYYDKDLKRWVNKSSGPEAAAPSPPPPPPRAQTASPGSSAFKSQPPPSPAPPPPARPATAVDLTDGPLKKPPMRVRSNLVPSEIASAPNTPASAVPPRTPLSSMDPPGLDGPPLAGARAKAGAKRNARSRYVDVFQQEGA